MHVSPNKWQVINRPPPEGKLTDLQREDLRFIRKNRQTLVDSLPADIPKTGMFGGNKEAVDKYTATTNQIAELTAKEDAIHAAVEKRSTPITRSGLQTQDRTTNAAPAVVAPENNPRAAEIKASFKAGKITREQAEQQLHDLGFE